MTQENSSAQNISDLKKDARGPFEWDLPTTIAFVVGLVIVLWMNGGFGFFGSSPTSVDRAKSNEPGNQGDIPESAKKVQKILDDDMATKYMLNHLPKP